MNTGEVELEINAFTVHSASEGVWPQNGNFGHKSLLCQYITTHQGIEGNLTQLNKHEKNKPTTHDKS